MVGIYKITKTATNECYIGKSIDIFGRWQQHIEQGKTALTSDMFHYELNACPEAFQFEIIEQCAPEELSKKEAYYMNFFGKECVYNKIAAARTKIMPINYKSPHTNKDIVKFLNSIVGIPLSVKDKEKVAEVFNYRDKRGNLLKWRTVKKKLAENGFEVMETKRNGKNCTIINVKFNY